MRERGFAIPMQLWVALGVLLVLAGVAVAFNAWRNGIEDRGYRRGLAEKQVEWDKAKLEQLALEQAREAAVARELQLVRQDAEAFAQAAEDFERKWKEALREARRSRVALGSCGAPASTEPAGAVADAGPGRGGDAAPAGGSFRAPSADGAGARGDSGIRLHWRFVGLHDGAFTGADGKPVFGDSASYALAPERADTASPYGLEELLEVHGENAGALAGCLRAYDQAMSMLGRAEAAWDKGTD